MSISNSLILHVVLDTDTHTLFHLRFAYVSRFPLITPGPNARSSHEATRFSICFPVITPGERRRPLSPLTLQLRHFTSSHSLSTHPLTHPNPPSTGWAGTPAAAELSGDNKTSLGTIKMLFHLLSQSPLPVVLVSSFSLIPDRYANKILRFLSVFNRIARQG